MGQSSLNQNIFRLVVGLVLLTAATILVNVWTTTNHHAEQQLARDLKIAQRVLEQVLANREAQLFNSASVLTSDFGFKQAIATRDKKTIDSVLQNHGERIEADLMALISLEGDTVTSVPNVLTSSMAFPYSKLIPEVVSNGASSTILLLNKRLYQVMLLTVDAPVPIAITLVGFELDEPFIQNLKNITQLDTSLRTQKSEQETQFISTLQNSSREEIIQSIDLGFDWFSVAFGNVATLTSSELVLTEQHQLRVSMILTENLNQLLAEFSKLQSTIAAIAVVAIILALIFAALLSRRLAKPLTQLSSVAGNIAAGNYKAEVDAQSRLREVSQLAEAFNSMQSSIVQREQEITYQAQHDVLTELYNRYHVGKLLDDKLAKRETFQAIGLNIFGFRGINDVFGYHNGDICLTMLARRVEKLGGLAARLTGGELLWVPAEPITTEQLQAIKLSLEQPVKTADLSINLKVAVGVISCPQDASNAETLFRQMNIVLDEAQITHQLLLRYDPELEARYSRRLAIITELEKALTTNQQELALHYQPKLNLNTGRVESAEALIRWNSQKLGFIPPDEFIVIAEHAGFIREVTSWVINQATKDLAIFNQSQLQISVAINLSAQDIVSPELLPQINDCLAKWNLSAKQLSLEITESDLVKDPKKAIHYLKDYRAAGHAIAIDDFGTGYSSLAYLKNLPVDTIKVDKSFVINLDSQTSDQSIVRSVLELAAEFKLSVIAEGIETLQSLKLLNAWGCQWAQGYYLCKPVPAEQFIHWCQSNENNNWLDN